MDFFKNFLHNYFRICMELKACIDVISKELNQNFTLNPEGFYSCENNGHIYKIFQRNNLILIQGSIGHVLKPQDSQTTTLLSNLLQFNLKRMQFLYETLFMDPDSQQLYLEKKITTNDLSDKKLLEHFEDFTLNIEVIEDRFFAKKSTKH